MQLNIQNSEDENILFNFDSVYDFIEQGLKEGGVLVHSEECLSRAPTIMIAFIIKRNKITYEEADAIVKAAKPDISPNEAFKSHLILFEKSVNKVIENYYKCGVCRKTLFDDSNIDFVHEFTPKTNYSYKRYKKSFVTSTECTSYFLNSLGLLNIIEDVGQRINCPGRNVRF